MFRFPANSIKADQTLDADEVAILSQNSFYAAGQVTYVTPADRGTATSFDLYVRGLLPTTTGLTLGQIAQVDLTGSTRSSSSTGCTIRSPNSCSTPATLVAGQSIAVGGPASGATNAKAVTVEAGRAAALGI